MSSPYEFWFVPVKEREGCYRVLAMVNGGKCATGLVWREGTAWCNSKNTDRYHTRRAAAVALHRAAVERELCEASQV